MKNVTWEKCIIFPFPIGNWKDKSLIAEPASFFRQNAASWSSSAFSIKPVNVISYMPGSISILDSLIIEMYSDWFGIS